jgi:hypothetical protein
MKELYSALTNGEQFCSPDQSIEWICWLCCWCLCRLYVICTPPTLCDLYVLFIFYGLRLHDELPCKIYTSSPKTWHHLRPHLPHWAYLLVLPLLDWTKFHTMEVEYQNIALMRAQFCWRSSGTDSGSFDMAPMRFQLPTRSNWWSWCLH